MMIDTGDILIDVVNGYSDSRYMKIDVDSKYRYRDG